jgi:hypothetical protein
MHLKESSGSSKFREILVQWHSFASQKTSFLTNATARKLHAVFLSNDDSSRRPTAFQDIQCMECQKALALFVAKYRTFLTRVCIQGSVSLSSIASLKCSQEFGMSLTPGMPLHNYGVRGLLRWQCQMVARTSSDVDSALENAFWIQGGDTKLSSLSSRPAFWYRLRGDKLSELGEEKRMKQDLLTRYALFWDITQRWMVILCRRFGKTYRSHLLKGQVV